MWIINNPFEVGEEISKKNMANDSYKVKMKTKWTEPYIIVEVSAVGSINSRINITIFKKTFTSKVSEKVLQEDAHRRI